MGFNEQTDGLHVRYHFWYISLRTLQNYNVNLYDQIQVL